MKKLDLRNYIRLSDYNREALSNSVKILNEATRSQLVNKSKAGADYKDKSKGRNRWERRGRSSIASTVGDFNRIDMNSLFQGDILQFDVKVRGETSNYVVTVVFEHVMKEIQREVKANKNKLEYKCILKALTRIFNSNDVYVACNCEDFKYRFSYVSTQGRYNAGAPEMRPAHITNPNDNLGAACKHINLVIANLSWLLKIASVINNYIYYCKDHMEYNYSRYIFPKVFGIPYDKAIQMSLFDYNEQGDIKDELQTDEEVINLSNMLGRTRTRFKKKPNPEPKFEQEKTEPEYTGTGK